jgi:hypothetical protein
LPPPDADPFAVALFPPGQREDDHLKLTENNIRVARRNHAEVLAAADLLRRLGDLGGKESDGADLAVAVLGWAHGAAADYPLRRFDPLHYIEPEFLARIGVPGLKYKEVTWTPKLLNRAIDYYATAVEGTDAEFRADMQRLIDSRAAALGRQVERLEAEAAAIIRWTENSRARTADAALLPPEYLAERVMRYEKHLNGLLTSTLHELERFQARRGGQPAIPPVVADVQVSVTAGTG